MSAGFGTQSALPSPSRSLAASSHFDDDESNPLGSTTGSSALSPRLASPRIGRGAGGLDPLDLDDVEYTVPSSEANKFWVTQPCAWARQPRVKQFLRPKFCAIPFTLTITACFISLAITLIVLHMVKDPAASIAPNISEPENLRCQPQLWTPGAFLIRNPLSLSTLMLLSLSPSFINYTSVTLPLLTHFNVSTWDHIAVFNGTHVKLYGPAVQIKDADTHAGAGALGRPPDTPQGFNSWGFRGPAATGWSREWETNSADEWFGRQEIAVFDAYTGPSGQSEAGAGGGGAAGGGSAGGGNVASTGVGRRRRLLADKSSTASPSSADTVSSREASALSGSELTSAGLLTRWYLFNNRTDVHTGAYAMRQQSNGGGGGGTDKAGGTVASSSSTGSTQSSSSRSSSTGVAGNRGTGASTPSSSSSSSTGVAGPSAPRHPINPFYNPRPIYTLRLFVQGNELRVCGEAFTVPVEPIWSSSSTAGSGA